MLKIKPFLEFKNRNDWIDILRGLSILLVLVTHGFLNLSFLGLDHILPKKNFDILRSNGYLGVSIFFVISGFLISKQLLSEPEKRTKKFKNVSNMGYFKSFYIKRLSRIVPPLLLLFMLGFILNLSNNDLFVDFQVDPLSLFFLAFLHAISFTYNYFYLGDGGATPGLRSYIPLWSLSIEEVYYLVYPILLRYLLKSRQFLFIFFIVLIILSPIYRFNKGNVSLYHIFGCFDMLAFGGLAYIAPKFRLMNILAKPISLFVILIALFVCLSCVDIQYHFVFAPSLIGFLAFLYLVFSDSQKQIIIKKPLRGYTFLFRLFGVLSYEVYLFHLMFLILFWRIDYDYGQNYLSTPLPICLLVLFSLICHIKIFEPIRNHILNRFHN